MTGKPAPLAQPFPPETGHERCPNRLITFLFLCLLIQ
jgi:hypothetical protein